VSDSDVVRKIIDELAVVADQLPRFHARRQEWTRGGFPQSSIPEAISRSSEPPLPSPDRIDATLENHRKWIRAAIIIMADQTSEMRRRLNSVLLVAPPIEDEPSVYACLNPRCEKIVTGVGSDRLRPGPVSGVRVCDRCRTHERRYGMAYPDGKVDPRDKATA
jgi:hypothetical protein